MIRTMTKYNLANIRIIVYCMKRAESEQKFQSRATRLAFYITRLKLLLRMSHTYMIHVLFCVTPISFINTTVVITAGKPQYRLEHWKWNLYEDLHVVQKEIVQRGKWESLLHHVHDRYIYPLWVFIHFFFFFCLALRAVNRSCHPLDQSHFLSSCSVCYIKWHRKFGSRAWWQK